MLREKLLTIFLLLFLCLGCSEDSLETETENEEEKEEQPIGEFIDDWTFKVFPESPYNNFDIGEFRVWLPKNSEELKAVLVLLTSSNGSALGLASAEEWQTFAEQENLALCSVNLKSLGGGGIYTAASGGSGQALIDALEKIGGKNNRPQIASLPLLFRGYSAGGVFGYNFSTYRPERSIAFVNIRGGAIEQTSERNKEVPGIILSGALEGDSRNAFLKDIVLNKRDDGGLWSFALEPGAGHFDNLKASDSLARIFFMSVLKKRIPDTAEELKPISPEFGWLGNITGTEAFPYADYPGNKDRANWLVDEVFAKAWLEFQK